MIDFSDASNEILIIDDFDFEVKQLTEVLEYMGLIDNKAICRIESMERYIFLYGNKQVIYNNKEREFIKSFGSIYVYNDVFRKTKNSQLPCRVIAAEIKTDESLKDCIFFIKEISKATSGLNVFFLKTNFQFHIGMNLFSTNNQDDFIISEPIITHRDIEALCDNLTYVIDEKDFMSYYISILSSLEYCDSKYNEDVYSNKRFQYSYIKMLDEIEKILKLDMREERERFYASLEPIKEIGHIELVQEAVLQLQFIEKFKANTVEMLFEAEEITRLMQGTESYIIASDNIDESGETVTDVDIQDFSYDIETMIKRIKQKKG